MKLSDYKQYFKVKNNDLFIDANLIKRRLDFTPRKIWILLRYFSGVATEKDIREFETDVVDYHTMRNRFNKNRKHLYKVVVERDGEFCQKCKALDNLTVDHVIPLIAGGSNDPENLQILCFTCNSRKGAR